MNQRILSNPISNVIHDSINKSSNELLIAVPFISSFAKKILDEKLIENIKVKRLITRFDETNINSFHLPTLKYFIENDISIRYNNDIHLKLYIFDDEGFISSSNLTESGFESKIEITSTIIEANILSTKMIFENLWTESVGQEITLDLIEENLDKYSLLKKKSKTKQLPKVESKIKDFKHESFNIEVLIDYLFNSKHDYSHYINNAFEANKVRNEIKNRIKKGYKKSDFYLPPGALNRSQTLHYKLLYDVEKNISGTGLFDSQLREVFEHNQFRELISYIYPPVIGEKDWALNDPNVFREYCNGIFNFNVPQYKETLPIRLASYFYPKFFIPIFKINQLEKTSSLLGLETNAKTKGDKLYLYNSFLLDKMKDIPYDNYVKSNISYKLFFTMELYERMKNGESFQSITDSHNEKWKKNFIKEGEEILTKLNTVPNKV